MVTRHEAVSTDGEIIPSTQVGPASGNGDAPVYLTAYGGFGLSLLPYSNSSIGKLWLERGGTCVVANIRGGGEFGSRWHDAGRRQGKRLTHDDFAAVADDLVRRGITQPRRIAAEGGSNGGLLIANMLTRYPELFGALFCTIPLVDMRRYTKLLAGASWIDEYGDPDMPEDWTFLRDISAYHAAAPGQPLSADPDRHHKARRARAPGPCAQDGRKAAGSRLSRLLLRAQRGRARLRQGQSGASRIHRPGQQFPSQCDRLAS
ncbi:hypothetical protein X737_35185 [Mesorhizobium sp. L48C026A00]|nr:hypothetical protein X737_35185 [Mesorhizobium sp. L48C026A00]